MGWLCLGAQGDRWAGPDAWVAAIAAATVSVRKSRKGRKGEGRVLLRPCGLNQVVSQRLDLGVEQHGYQETQGESSKYTAVQ